MSETVIVLSIPGLRPKDLPNMARTVQLFGDGDRAELVATFPASTCPVQANMTTGTPPAGHGVVANGTYHRQSHRLEMWTEPNDCIAQPQWWDRLHEHDQQLTSAVWFPMHSKHCGADYVCLPAPIHNPDGSESLWCYTKPTELYGDLRDQFGHFPLQHFWGPMANIKSTEWIVSSAIEGARRFRPNLFYIYLPHLDYAAQKHGPDSSEAETAVRALDAEIGRLIEGLSEAYGNENLLWLAASEYVITPVSDVVYPNRLLREAGLLEVTEQDGGEVIDFAKSRAWALADHQYAHVYTSDDEAKAKAADVLKAPDGVAEVLDPAEAPQYDLNHPHAGDLVVVSQPDSWLAYYYWLDDARAPEFARTVDIHRKPGYDPVELFFDLETKSVPLDATLVRGSHGAPPLDASQRGVLLSSARGVFVEQPLADTDVADIVLRQFGV